MCHTAATFTTNVSITMAMSNLIPAIINARQFVCLSVFLSFSLSVTAILALEARTKELIVWLQNYSCAKRDFPETTVFKIEGIIYE